MYQTARKRLLTKATFHISGATETSYSLSVGVLDLVDGVRYQRKAHVLQVLRERGS